MTVQSMETNEESISEQVGMIERGGEALKTIVEQAAYTDKWKNYETIAGERSLINR